MHAKCATAFAGSHMCHLAEYARANPMTSPPSTGLWLDVSAAQLQFDRYTALPFMGRYIEQTSSWNCVNWTVTTGTGLVVQASGPTSAVCSAARPVACCK